MLKAGSIRTSRVAIPAKRHWPEAARSDFQTSGSLLLGFT